MLIRNAAVLSSLPALYDICFRLQINDSFPLFILSQILNFLLKNEQFIFNLYNIDGNVYLYIFSYTIHEYECIYIYVYLFIYMYMYTDQTAHSVSCSSLLSVVVAVVVVDVYQR